MAFTTARVDVYARARVKDIGRYLARARFTSDTCSCRGHRHRRHRRESRLSEYSRRAKARIFSFYRASPRDYALFLTQRTQVGWDRRENLILGPFRVFATRDLQTRERESERKDTR